MPKGSVVFSCPVGSLFSADVRRCPPHFNIKDFLALQLLNSKTDPYVVECRTKHPKVFHPNFPYLHGDTDLETPRWKSERKSFETYLQDQAHKQVAPVEDWRWAISAAMRCSITTSWDGEVILCPWLYEMVMPDCLRPATTIAMSIGPTGVLLNIAAGVSNVEEPYLHVVTIRKVVPGEYITRCPLPGCGVTTPEERDTWRVLFGYVPHNCDQQTEFVSVEDIDERLISALSRVMHKCSEYVK
eukprot:PhF_6_TR14124/c0_g1_i2/m.22581